MATFKICIFKHQQRKDEKYPVSIRVCWKGNYSYIKTEYYVIEKQIDKKTFTVKDTFIKKELNQRIADFEEIKSRKLGINIELYTAKELADYLVKEVTPGSDNTIDFIQFALLHCERLKKQGRGTTANRMKCSLNALIDFCNGRKKIAITEITSKFLTQFDAFIRVPRTIKREDQYGRLIKRKANGASDIGVFGYMTDIRTFFNAAIEEYNDDEKGEVRISHYPFKKYKLERGAEPEKRNLTIEQVRSILKASEDDLNLGRTIFARDIFILSFALVGMNLIDLYNIENHEYTNGRFTYKRTKTKNTRKKDNALISIRVEPEIGYLIEKYRDKTGKRVFDFYKRYCEPNNFTSAVTTGLKNVAKACNIGRPVSSYYARHSWANIARNKCKISKDDICLSLNHTDQGLKTTDVYIEKDWRLIDNANRKVIDLLYKHITDTK